MKQVLTLFVTLIAGAVILTGCASTTGGGATGSDRSQFLLISSEEVNAGSAQAYTEEMNKARSANALNVNKEYTRRVKEITNRLIPQVKVFRPDAVDWQWEVNVINSDTVNAYCMPGGKIAVYTGIISALKLTDDELAAIIGHEMAHALREHSREQISQQLATQSAIAIGGSLLGLGQTSTNLTQKASELVLTLPFSRTMEAESDIIGMELMARAGYNPEAAINVWVKMGQLSEQSAPEFLSTHPSGESRIANLKKELPKVMPLYEEAKGNFSASTGKSSTSTKKAARKNK